MFHCAFSKIKVLSEHDIKKLFHSSNTNRLWRLLLFSESCGGSISLSIWDLGTNAQSSTLGHVYPLVPRMVFCAMNETSMSSSMTLLTWKAKIQSYIMLLILKQHGIVIKTFNLKKNGFGSTINMKQTRTETCQLWY